jgi:hypothetical protein
MANTMVVPSGKPVSFYDQQSLRSPRGRRTAANRTTQEDGPLSVELSR